MTCKTLHLTNSWHHESGGIATFYREMLAAAERLHRPMRLVVPAESDRMQEHGRFGRIFHVAARPSRLSPGYRLIMPTRYALPRSVLRRIIADERPDLVECCDRYTLNYLAAFLRRGWFIRGYRPTVVGLVCERMDESVARYVTTNPLAKPFCRLYLKWLHFPMFDHHIANSAHTAEELHEAARGHAVRRGVWIRPMGAACRVFGPQRRSDGIGRWLRNLCGVPEACRLLLYVGRLVPEKRLNLLVEVMERLEFEVPGAFHLLIAGDGGLRSHLEAEFSRRAGGAARFLGHVGDRDALADLYANCDIFLHPNPREPFGIAPLEAMASGLPVVAPNSGGLMSYADSANAWLADCNAVAFTKTIYSVCNNGDAAASRTQAARATAEQYDWEKVTGGFFDLYDELHSYVQGAMKEPVTAPAFYSTAGNHFGWEI